MHRVILRHEGTDDQRNFWTSPAKYRAFVGGIGSGKTRAGCVEVLRQPARSVGMVVAPTYRMLHDATQLTFLDLARRGSVLADHEKSDNAVRLIDGKHILFRSADDPDKLRGPNIDWFWLDEAAMCSPDTWLIMIGRLRGSGAVKDGDLRGWCTSSPRGRGNWMYRAFLGEKADHALIRASTRNNKFLPKDFVKGLESQYSERWRQQEIDGEFIDDGGRVFRYVRECATVTPSDVPITGHNYVFGIDWGRDNDFTVCTVVDTTVRQLVYMDRFTGIDYRTQLQRITALAERFKPFDVYAEKNSMGGPLVEELGNSNLPVFQFNTNNENKRMIIDNLTLAFERRAIGIPNDEVLIAELEAYESSQTATGLIKFGAPEGMHDDCVMSLAIAWQGVGGGLFA